MGLFDFMGGISNPEGGFSKLFSDPQFLQYLSGIGNGLATEGFPGAVKAAGSITAQNITSKNYMKILQKMLSGDMSDGGKLTMDKDGMKINVPTFGATLGEGLAGAGPNPVGGAVAGSTSTQTAPQNNSILSAIGKTFNPFGNGQSISASDLAGLSPEMLTQAMQFRFGQEELKNKSLNDLTDALYKGKMMEYYDSQMSENRNQMEVARQNAATNAFKALTDDQRSTLEKEFDAAKRQGFEGEIWDWKILASDPETIKLYNASVEDGSWNIKRDGGLWKFIEKKAKAGATNLQLSPYEQTRQRESAQAQASVLSPSFASDVLKDLSKSDTWDMPTGTTNYEEVPAAQKKLQINEMGDRIRRAFGNENVTPVKGGWEVVINGKKEFIRGPQ
jgi:hypothetical protein